MSAAILHNTTPPRKARLIGLIWLRFGLTATVLWFTFLALFVVDWQVASSGGWILHLGLDALMAIGIIFGASVVASVNVFFTRTARSPSFRDAQLEITLLLALGAGAPALVMWGNASASGWLFLASPLLGALVYTLVRASFRPSSD